jgi:hypothetical protein
MALFIQPENQNILWEMVNKIPLCNTVFSTGSGSGSQNEKQIWFKKIIEDFYKRLPPNISRNDLYQINREVLAAMMKSLGELYSVKQNTMDRGIFSRLDNNNTIETNKTEYEIRQSQYKSMFEIQKPTQIDFSEKLDDDVITNMEELIEKQKKLRELDYQQLLPIQKDQNIKVNILEDVPKESIQPQTIKPLKQVHFDLPQEQIKKDELSEINQKMENMEKKINQIFELLQILTKTNNVLEKNEENNNIEVIKEMMILNEINDK